MNKTLTSLQTFRAKLETNLRAEFSWLSLAGLFWLEPGENNFGTGAGNAILLPEGTAPENAGCFQLNEDGSVQVNLTSDSIATINDQAISTAEMKPDSSGAGTFLHLNDLRFLVIERGGMLAIRLWWRSHPNRLNFQGRKWYEAQEAYRITAQVVPYDPPKKVIIPDIVGNETENEVQAQLVMEKDGQTFCLDAMLIPNGRYYIVFKDATAGDTTYPAARFLVTEVVEGDRVMVDFNKAYSPPCAFTAHATCPLPTRDNALTLPIEAGERYVKIG